MGLARLFRSARRDQEAQLAHTLREAPLFREVAASDLVLIWRRLEQITAAAGVVICRRGEPGDLLYVVRTGLVQVRLGLGPTGMPLRLLGAGEIIGEMSLLTGEERSADVVVVEDAVLWTLDRVHFETLLDQSAPLLRALNRALCDRLGRLTRLVEEHDAGLRQGAAGLRFGPYRVVEQIGSGGTSVVYSAHRQGTETLVAIKVLPAGWGAAPELRARLRREAEVLGAINHPNVIRLLEVGEVEARLGGGTYLALEWLPHGLHGLLRAGYPDPLPLDNALRITAGVAAGVAAAHSVGVAHRDIKPSNILLRPDGSPVVSDFGLALFIAEQGVSERLTPSNVIVGTADYLSPEYIAGLEVDGRSDVYALGVLLYEMVVGYVPFAGRDPVAIFRAHLEEQPPALPMALPEGVRAIVERALRKRPADRYPSAAAMETDLLAARARLG